MDPFTCLSVATAAVQFLDFGAKVLRVSRDVYEDRCPVPIEHVRKINDDLITATISLEQHTRQPAALDSDEKALDQLLRDCRSLAFELAILLERLLTTYSQNKVWDSLVKAVKTVIRKDSINDMEQRLSRYREEIMLRILVLLNAHRHALDDKMTALKEKGDEIVEVIALNFDQLRNDLDQKSRKMHTALAMQDLASDRRQHDVQAAILTTKQGQTLALTRPLGSNFGSMYAPASTCQQHSTIFRMPSGSDGSSELSKDDQSLCISAVRHILDVLHFPRMVTRCAAVTPAHEKTFDWIFDVSHRSGESWDDLGEWLKHGSGCYWVSGKAGSGKSTFMKFLEYDVRTTVALEAWARGSQLLISSFYFWYAGTDLEKSQEGLFRAILHAALSKRPDLALTLFPEVYRSFLLGESVTFRPFALADLRTAFLKFADNLPADVKFCLFVDGIDEYDGDHNDVCNALLEATKSRGFKAILSSRPIPSCVSAFSTCPQLGLHQLTKQDILCYIDSELGSHPLMIKMNTWKTGSFLRIAEELTTRASGVFLWVVLVVKLLISGLQEYDSLPELLERIDTLPPDLERLYDHMLGSMSHRHRVDGSKMLQLVLRSMFTHEEFPLTLLQFSFAQEDKCRLAKLSNFYLPAQDQIDWQLESVEGRIRSRCHGLIEVADSGRNNGQNATRRVRFLHRTVVEFLQLGQIWNQISSETRDTAFDVDDALLASSILETASNKTVAKQSVDGFSRSSVDSICRVLTYIRTMKECDDSLVASCLQELQRVASSSWGDRLSSGKSSTALQSAVAQLIASSALPITFEFLIYAACHSPTIPLLWFLIASSGKSLLSDSRHMRLPGDSLSRHSIASSGESVLDESRYKRSPIQNPQQRRPDFPGELLDTPMMQSKEEVLPGASASNSKLFIACVLLNFAESISVRDKTAMAPTISRLLLDFDRDKRVRLPNQLELLWKNQWKWALLPQHDQTWTPWEFLLLWVADYSRSLDTTCTAYARSELPEACCEMFLRLISDGAKGELTFSIQPKEFDVQPKKRARSQSVSPRYILRQFMLKTWTLRNASEKNPTKADVRLAREMTKLDDAMEKSLWSNICETEGFTTTAISGGNGQTDETKTPHTDLGLDVSPWKSYALLESSSPAEQTATPGHTFARAEPQVMDAI